MINARTVKLFVIAGILVALTACGADESGNNSPDNSRDRDPAPGEGTDDEGNGDDAPNLTTNGIIEDGKYYMSAGHYEGSDADGNKIDRQTLQIAGDYFWVTEHQGDNKFEVTASGSAKLSANNDVLAEVNCVGAQDVYAFEVISSGSLRNFAQLEAGCPQSAKLNASQQMSIRSLNSDTFEYTVVTQNDGVRIVETYVFRK